MVLEQAMAQPIGNFEDDFDLTTITAIIEYGAEALTVLKANADGKKQARALLRVDVLRVDFLHVDFLHVEF